MTLCLRLEQYFRVTFGLMHIYSHQRKNLGVWNTYLGVVAAHYPKDAMNVYEEFLKTNVETLIDPTSATFQILLFAQANLLKKPGQLGAPYLLLKKMIIEYDIASDVGYFGSIVDGHLKACDLDKVFGEISRLKFKISDEICSVIARVNKS
ncbi:unnamed protein product [Cochlearia groenlandica]